MISGSDTSSSAIFSGSDTSSSAIISGSVISGSDTSSSAIFSGSVISGSVSLVLEWLSIYMYGSELVPASAALSADSLLSSLTGAAELDGALTIVDP